MRTQLLTSSRLVNKLILVAFLLVLISIPAFSLLSARNVDANAAPPMLRGLFSWGGNESGELGQGSTSGVRTPARVNAVGQSQFISISAGGSHSLAVDSYGSLFAFGCNRFGQVGVAGSANFVTPQMLVFGHTGGRQFVAVAAGYGHSLALDNRGNLYSWGLNSSGQLGNGTFANVATMQRVALGLQFKAISGGGAHSLAIDLEGNIFAFGCNAYGQLGSGGSSGSGGVSNKLYPTKIVQQSEYLYSGGSATYFVGVSAGGAHSLALDNMGRLFAFGKNDNGQLGIGHYENTYALVQVGIGQSNGEQTNGGQSNGGQVGDSADSGQDRRFISFSAGYRHSVAVDTNNSVYAWGFNYPGGLLGAAVNDVSANSPLRVLASVERGVRFDFSAVYVSAGRGHTLAICLSGSVWAFGSNNASQLGDPSTDSLAHLGRNYAIRVVPNQMGAVSAGGAHSLAVGPIPYARVDVFGVAGDRFSGFSVSLTLQGERAVSGLSHRVNATTRVTIINGGTRNLEWTTSNANVADVSAQILIPGNTTFIDVTITAVGEGTATITARSPLANVADVVFQINVVLEPEQPIEPCPVPCPEPCERCGEYYCDDYYCDRECREPYEPYEPKPCPTPCPVPCPDCNKYDCKGECYKDCIEPYEPTPCPVPCPEPCPECNKYDCKGECQKDCTEPYEPYEPKPCPEPCERCGKYDCYDYYCNRECTEPYEPTPCPVPCPVPCPKPCPDCNEYDCKGECQKDCKEPYEPKPCPTPCPEPCEICGEYYCDGNCEPYEPTPCPVPCPEPCATCGYYPCICASVQIIFICDQFLWEALVSISIANVAGFSFTSLAIPFENNARVNLNYYYDAQFAGWNFNGELITALSQSFFANSNIIVIVSEWTPICLGNHPVYVPCNLVEINEDVRTVAAIGTIIGLTSLVYASDKIRARRRDKRLEKELVS